MAEMGTFRRPLFKKFSRPYRLLVMVGVGLFIVFVLNRAGIIETLELATYDLRLWLRGARPPPAAIVIVAINDESFNALQQNIRTWPRAEYARLVNVIAGGNPAVIGVDIAWPGDSPDPSGNRILARSLNRAGNVVLAGLMEYQAGAGYRYTRYAGPAETLARTAAGVGLVNLPRDNDGVVRRVVLRQFHHSAWYPAFGYEVMRVYRHQPAASFDSHSPVSSEDAGPSSPVDSQELYINFCGGRATFPTFSMYQVLNGEIPPETFAKKIVLIGFTTFLEHDLHATAFNPPWGSPELLPGVEIHANVVATLLKDNPIRPVPGWIAAALTALAAGFTILAFWRLRPVRAVIASAGLTLLYLAATFFLFAGANLWLPLIAPVGVAGMIATGGLVERVLIEEREKRRIRARFESFMAPERLATVLNRWEELVATDRPEITATVLFSDIRGFTSATEYLTRQGRSSEVIRFLNRYTDAMIEAIFAGHGVLDKMLGDGLLVLFGAPHPTPNHARQAVTTALRMAELVPELNQIWPLRDRRPLRIGIGIHTGSLMDGIIGRGRRVEYTVIGDAVNTASRIEGYTKEVLARRLAQEGDDGRPNTTILISHQTYCRVKDYVQVDSTIPPCRAKGKAEPIPVYRLLGLREPGEETER